MAPGTRSGDYVSDHDLEDHGLEVVNSLFSEMERLEAMGEGSSNDIDLDRFLRDIRLESINREFPQARGTLRRGNDWNYQLERQTGGDRPVDTFDDFNTLLLDEDQTEGSGSSYRFRDVEQSIDPAWRDQERRLYAER